MSNKIILKRGDEFAVQGTSWISKAILWISRRTSLQGKATYSHVGIILTPEGGTLEALWDGIKYSYMKQYIGRQVIIVRNIKASDEAKDYGIKKCKEFKGKPYPYWRLFFHAIPGFSKFNLIRIPVCSELVKFYQRILSKFINPSSNVLYWGYKPYRLVMDYRISKHYETIFEGVWHGIENTKNK